MATITSIEDLKNWNANPTQEKPFVIHWFYDWFFETLIINGRYKEAIDAQKTMVEFTQICEKMTFEDAIKQTNENLRYYNGYGSMRWGQNWKTFMKLDEFPKD